MLEHLFNRLGKQLVHLEFAFTHEQFRQEPLLLHLQQVMMTKCSGECFYHTQKPPSCRSSHLHGEKSLQCFLRLVRTPTRHKIEITLQKLMNCTVELASYEDS